MYSGASAAPGASGCTRHSLPHQLWAACPAALAGGIHSKVFSVQEAEASRTGCSVSGDLCIDCPWYHPIRDEVESSAGVEPAPSRVLRERILMRQLPIWEGCSSPVRPQLPALVRTTRPAARGTRTPLCRRAGAYLTLREGAISPSPTPTPSGRGMCAVPRGRSVPAVMRN